MKNLMATSLSDTDFKSLLAICYDSAQVTSFDSFKKLLIDLEQLVPSNHLIFVTFHYSGFLPDVQPTVESINLTFPEEYLELYFSRKYYLSDGIVYKSFHEETSLNWRYNYSKSALNGPEYDCANQFGLRDGWLTNQFDRESQCGFLLCAGGQAVDSSLRSEKIFNYITPYLIRAYKHLRRRACPVSISLTPRETEALNWIKAGKSSWETSLIMKCSERTIDFHINNVMAKLNTVNRVQAVATALRYRLIDF